MLCLSEGYGGLELYAAEEVKQLQSRGHDCLPVVTQNSMLHKHLYEAGIEPVCLHVINRRLPALAARKLARLIEKQKIDLIHIHWNNDLNLAVLAKRFSQRKPKLVYSRHMAITRSKKDPLHRWFYSEVDCLIVVTKLMQQEAETYLPLPKSRIHQLYLGVADMGDVSPNYKDCYAEGFPQRKLNIALFGRIEPYKGQHVLVSAVSQLVNEGLDISATIIGHIMDKKYFTELEKSVKANNLSNFIKFESFVKNPIQRMKCYDVVVLTTYCETFGLVLIEAMRAGVMVIGTNAGGVKEIITDNETGLLFEPDDVQNLKTLLCNLYKQPEQITRLAENGKQKAAMVFSEQNHFNALAQVLSTVFAC